MRESIEILSDPELAGRVRAGRLAVAGAEIVSYEELGGPTPAPEQWRVVLTAPVAHELEQMDQPRATGVRETLAALTRSPAEHGRALGMGLVGVWSVRGASHRILYAIQQEQRLVTVLTVDDR
ncbi:MAG: type II toxin-antitoxin system RelE family toxin [Solirubrobacteraceae bacterium]